MNCADHIELAAWRFLAEHKTRATDGDNAIRKALDMGMTWPLGCHGIPKGYRFK